MHNISRWLIAVAALAMLVQPRPAAGQQAEDEIERVEASMAILRDLTRQSSDHRIPPDVLARAEAVIVIPDMIRGGLIVGGKHGRGVVSIRDRSSGGWSPPAFVAMTGGSVGWQIGAESVDLVLLVMNQDGVRRLLDNRFTLGGDLSATAGPVGASAGAATDISLGSQLLAYSRAKGLFAGATLEGVSLREDDGANEEFYGRELELRDITVDGAPRARAPIIVAQWADTMRAITARSYADEPLSTTGSVSVTAVVDNPGRYSGRHITIAAPVEDVHSRTIFSVDDDDSRSTGREVIVINPYPAGLIDEEGTVVVRGIVYEFDRRDLERRLVNWRWDVSDDVLRSFNERPVLIADSIRDGNRELVLGPAMRTSRISVDVDPPFAASPGRFDGVMTTVAEVLDRPRDFYKRQVMVTAEVEDVYSRTAFAIDDDRLVSTGRDVLVIAPSIRRPVADDLDVTIVGEVIQFNRGAIQDRLPGYQLDLRDDVVRKFNNRPVIIATSIRTRDGEELLGGR